MFELPKLNYKFSELEPVIDAKTMEIHLAKHHQTYVTNLNNALKDQLEIQNCTIEELICSLNDLPESIRTAVRNNGGGHYNHSLFWQMMKPAVIGVVNQPEGKLLKEIEKEFGSFDTFKETFTKAGLTRFGSGWAWLNKDKMGKLTVTSTANQDSPLMEGSTPLLGLDVWEHAYYLNYQNRRADYINEWWKVVNWEFVSSRYN